MAQFVAHHQRVMRFGKLAALSGQNSTRRRFVIIGKPSRKALMGSHSLLAIAAAVALCACNRDAREEQGAASAPIHVYRATGKAVSAELTGYNHTDQTIAAFHVNGQWGGNIFPGTGGGKFVCCVRLPAQWHEGLVVQVSWEDHELKTQSREVAVPRYEAADVADFNVHFLRDGNIKVFATRGGLRSRDYPLVGPESELKPGVPIEKASWRCLQIVSAEGHCDRA